MSRVDREMVCENCGWRWEGYLDFGHPETSFEYEWVCEQCVAVNTRLVEEWISDKGPQNHVRIYRYGDTAIKLFIDCFHSHKVLDIDSFEWKESEDSQAGEYVPAHMELSDVSNQLLDRDKGKLPGMAYVWVEEALSGAIYRYIDGNWYLHGRTNGHP